MANTIRLRRGSTAPTAGSFVEGEPAWDSTNGRLYIKNAAGTMVQIGASGSGDVVAASANAFTGANTFYNATGQTFGTGTAANDGILLQGRAGGTSTFRSTLIPGTLTASRTLTLPDVTGTVITTGDTGTVTGTMLATNTVVNADLAQVATATFKGRTTAGTGNVEDLTTAQATALLDAFTSTTKGLAPLSGGGTTNFLRADGTWAAPTTTTTPTQVVSLTSTQQSTATALANVTQLVGTLAANATYEIDCFVTFQSAATTTGLNLGFTSPTGCRPMVEIVVPIVSTAAASALRTTFPNAAATTSGNVLGTGVTAINSNHTARISGIIKNGATAGNFQIQFATEVAASAVTLQIGSTMQLTRIA